MGGARPKRSSRGTAEASEAEAAPAGEDEKPKARMRTAREVIDRLLWDSRFDAELVSVGLVDRLLAGPSGVIERPLLSMEWGEDLAAIGCGDPSAATAIPQHRIVYFKYQEQTIWEKATRLDRVFASTGGESVADALRPEMHPAAALAEEAARVAPLAVA